MNKIERKNKLLELLIYLEKPCPHSPGPPTILYLSALQTNVLYLSIYLQIIFKKKFLSPNLLNFLKSRFGL